MMATKTTQGPEIMFSLFKIVFLHLLPGLPALLVYAMLTPLGTRWGYPPIFSFTLAIIVTLIPVQMGILFWHGYKLHGRLTLKGVILYRQRTGLLKAAWYVLILVIWSILTFVMLSGPLRDFIISHYLQWAPQWYLELNTFTGPSHILWITWTLMMIFGAFIVPAVEELYFRGFLLPRMTRLGKWAPFINALLFAMYHLWSPWDVITRTIAVTPLSYIVSKQKNLYIGLVAHIILNALSTLAMISIILSK